MIKNLLTAFLGLLILFASACSADIPTGEQFDIEKDFSIEMREVLTPNGNSLTFVVTTKSNQNCLNDTITNSHNASSVHVEIALNDIAHEGECEPGDIPAQAIIPIGDLALKSYEMNINLRGDIISLGQLHVENNHYRLAMEEEKGFEIIHETLLRVPTFTVWGSVEYADAMARQAAQDFILQLNNISTSSTFDAGYYGWFEINEMNNFNYYNAPLSDNFISFIYEYQGEEAALIDLLETTRENETLTLQFKTWDGRDL